MLCTPLRALCTTSNRGGNSERLPAPGAFPGHLRCDVPALCSPPTPTPLLHPPPTPLAQPVMIFNPAKLPAVSRHALHRGLAIVVVGFPATPLLTARMRVCISASHSKADLDYALEVFEELSDRWGAARQMGGHVGTCGCWAHLGLEAAAAAIADVHAPCFGAPAPLQPCPLLSDNPGSKQARRCSCACGAHAAGDVPTAWSRTPLCPPCLQVPPPVLGGAKQACAAQQQGQPPDHSIARHQVQLRGESAAGLPQQSWPLQPPACRLPGSPNTGRVHSFHAQSGLRCSAVPRS